MDSLTLAIPILGVGLVLCGLAGVLLVWSRVMLAHLDAARTAEIGARVQAERAQRAAEYADQCRRSVESEAVQLGELVDEADAIASEMAEQMGGTDQEPDDDAEGDRWKGFGRG